MTTAKHARRITRLARDFLLGLGLFAAAALSGIAGGSSGNLVDSANARLFDASSNIIAETASGGMSLHHVEALVSFALVFASMFALNLWFVRHLRRVHAAPRRLE